MINRLNFIISSVCLSTGAAFACSRNVPVKSGAVSYRLQPHYAPITGFINDPDGFVFYHGEYHLLQRSGLKA